MSDNYYATRTEEILANQDEDGLSVTVSKTTRIHIGKSNGGCAFMLHIYPDVEGLDIRSEIDMMRTLKQGSWAIDCDLYGSITLAMLRYHMKLPEAPVFRSEHCVGSSHNCDYFTNSFC